MSTQTALIVIDMQCGLIDENNSHHKHVLARLQKLLQQAHDTETPVIYVQHQEPEGYELEPGSEKWQIHPSITPLDQEPVVAKRAPDSFYDTTLKEELDKHSITHLVITGAQTNCCVDSTARRATTLGYTVTLVGDAHLTEDTDVLNEAQIIAFTNYNLNGFGADNARIRVKETADIQF